MPGTWFPDFRNVPTDVLCLASGGGQQAPILAAAGANVTVFDNSSAQLAQDQLVADRDGLSLRTEQGDMTDLSRFDNQSFDLIFHPCSNCFVESVLPVWNEAFRVLRPGGSILSGFSNPLLYLFDDDLLQNGQLEVRYKIPYSDKSSLNKEQRRKFIESNEPCAFGHTLEDQIGGQLAAGFQITGFFEDSFDQCQALSQYIDSFIATRATKPSLQPGNP